MTFIRRYWNWCRRFRHRCGYGVHSPSDFYLITSVIYEDLPYYAYDELKMKPFGKSQPHYRRKVNKLLFRLVNYLRPQTLMVIGTGNGASYEYMCAARKTQYSCALQGVDLAQTLKELEGSLSMMNRWDMLHIAHTPYYKEVFEKVLPFINEGTCLIIGEPYASKDKETWWKQLLENEKVVLTFDLFDIGLVFFDKKRCKQHHIVNFL